MRLTVATLVFAMVAALSPVTATASGDGWREPQARPTFALKRTVVFENHAHHDWRVRATVRNFNRRIAAVRLIVGRCARHPNAGCVKVRGVTDKPWWGQWDYHGRFRGTIRLDRSNGRHRLVSCHEIGHALGIKGDPHHDGPGCVRLHNRMVRASRPEMRALRESYTSYRRQSAMWP